MRVMVERGSVATVFGSARVVAEFGEGETVADVTEGRMVACSLEDVAVMVFIERARAAAAAGVEERVVPVRLASPSSSRGHDMCEKRELP